MADMSDVLEVLTSIENYLIDLPTKIMLKADQIFIVNGLSDVSENLGIVTAGEFRAGNRNEPGMFLRTTVAGSGFSGMRMRYPAMSYDLDGVMTDWNLVGINDDILQFGVRASDGKLVAGGGAVILDADGITAVGGTIAGWTINTDHLLSPGTPGIKIASTGSIETTNFVTGGSGWKISESGDIEFNNAVIRGELRTTVLTYQEVQAVSGTMGVFHSAGVLLQDFTLPAVPSGTYSLWTKAPNSTNPQIFGHNHILQIKNGLQSTWLIIDGGFGGGGDGRVWQCSYLSGTTDVTYTIGQAVISYGVSGDGFLLMEAIGTGAPYFSVRTHAGAPYTATTEHVRMGNLNGGWGYSSDIYGVAIGQYAAGKGNITVDPTDGIKINIHTDNIMQFNSSGAFITNVLNMTGDDAAIAIGATPPTSASDYGLWIDKNGMFVRESSLGQQLFKISLPDNEITFIDDVIKIDVGGMRILAEPAVKGVVGSLRFRNGIDTFSYGQIIGSYNWYPTKRVAYGIELNSYAGLDDYPPDYTVPSISLNVANGGTGKTFNFGVSENGFGGAFDGWNILETYPDRVEFIYVSSTSFTLSTYHYTLTYDVTSVFTTGTKIKFTQNSTIKYCYVTSSSYSADTKKTTINVTGDAVLDTATYPVNMETFYYSHALVADGISYQDKVQLKEVTTPSTPPSGQVSLYAKDDGLLYTKDDLGIEKFVGGYFDGWIPINIAPVYVSATSIRFESIDLSGAFPVGTKIKFTQTTVKYFYVVGVSYSGGNTDLTVTGDAVANATISNFYYSHAFVAKGAPDTGGVWKNYTPTWTAATTNPSIGNGTLLGRYCIIGKTSHLKIVLEAGSTTTFGSGDWYFSLPVSSYNYYEIGPLLMLDSGSGWHHSTCRLVSATILYSPFLSSGAPFTWAKNDILWAQITYEIA